jgi:hypothetical protein
MILVLPATIAHETRGLLSRVCSHRRNTAPGRYSSVLHGNIASFPFAAAPSGRRLCARSIEIVSNI